MAAQIETTVLKVGTAPLLLNPQDRTFPTDNISMEEVIDGGINTSILYEGVVYYVSETLADLITAANAGGGGTTDNTTESYLPYKSSGGTFEDSSITQVGDVVTIGDETSVSGALFDEGNGVVGLGDYNGNEAKPYLYMDSVNVSLNGSTNMQLGDTDGNEKGWRIITSSSGLNHGITLDNISGGSYPSIYMGGDAGTSKMKLKTPDGLFNLQGLLIFADNATAISGGLFPNDVYKTATGELRIVV